MADASEYWRSSELGYIEPRPPAFDFEGVEFRTVEPQTVNDDTWRASHDVSLRYWHAELGTTRTATEIDYFAGTDWREFRDSRLDPQSLVGGRFNPDQTFKRPLLTLALAVADTRARRPFGFAFTNSNVSGDTPEIRTQKEQLRYLNRFNYRAFREVVVDPRQRFRGLETGLGYYGLRTAHPGQRGVIYTFPKEAPDANLLKHTGAQLTGSQEKHLFGPDAASVKMERHQTRAAPLAAYRMLLVPGLRRGLRQAKS